MTTLRLGDIKPNPDNPRIIKDDKYKKLVQSLKDFPIFLQKRGILLDENNMILGGNMRYRAAKDAGLKEIPVEYFTREDAEENNKLTGQNKTYEEYCQEAIIKDNVSGGEWDWDILVNQWDVDLLDKWGVDIPEQISNKEVEEDEPPEVSSEPAISKLGEIYQLGRHRLMCGDSTDKKTVRVLLGTDKPDVIYSDPPYGMNLDADYSKMNSKLEFVKDKHLKSKTGNKYENVIGDHADFDPSFITTLLDIGEDCKEVFLWGADYYAELLPAKNDGSWFVWDKRLDESSDKMYGSTFELVWSKSKHKRSIVRVKWAGVFGTEQEFDRKRQHPTQKPIKLSAYFIENYSNKDDMIVDLFLGSGSTLIACEQTDRICYGMELDPKYCDVIRKRYWKFVNNNDDTGWEENTPVINERTTKNG